MEREIVEPVYKEIFPFWEEITEGDRDYICRHSMSVTYEKGAGVQPEPAGLPG